MLTDLKILLRFCLIRRIPFVEFRDGICILVYMKTRYKRDDENESKKNNKFKTTTLTDCGIHSCILNNSYDDWHQQ